MSPFERDIHQPRAEGGVIHPGGGGGARVARLRMEIAVWVDVNDVGLALGGEPQVHSAVVAAAERLEGGECRAYHLVLHLGREQDAARRDCRGTPGAGRLPLGPVTHNSGAAVEGLPKMNFAQGEHHPWGVAQKGDIHLAPGHEALHQRWLVERAQHELDRLAQGSAVMHHRVKG